MQASWVEICVAFHAGETDVWCNRHFNGSESFIDDDDNDEYTRRTAGKKENKL